MSGEAKRPVLGVESRDRLATLGAVRRPVRSRVAVKVETGGSGQESGQQSGWCGKQGPGSGTRGLMHPGHLSSVTCGFRSVPLHPEI